MGFWARAMGAPIRKIVLAVNANRTIPDYLETGKYEPRQSIETLANAMDVGAPSNMERLFAMFPDWESFRSNVSSYAVSDDEIRAVVDSSLDQWQNEVADEVTERVMARIGDRLVSAESESGSDAPATAGRVISTPDFTGLPEVTVQDEYASARESARESAIDSLYASLGL